MQWHQLAHVPDRFGCRVWLLCREAPMGTNHLGRPDGAHRSSEQRDARDGGRRSHVLVWAKGCGRFFPFVSGLAHFCFCGGVHAARALVTLSVDAEEEGARVGRCLALDS